MPRFVAQNRLSPQRFFDYDDGFDYEDESGHLEVGVSGVFALQVIQCVGYGQGITESRGLLVRKLGTSDSGEFRERLGSELADQQMETFQRVGYFEVDEAFFPSSVAHQTIVIV